MTLRNFLNTYDGCSLISIKGYCEECDKDTVKLEEWYKDIQTRTETARSAFPQTKSALWKANRKGKT